MTNYDFYSEIDSLINILNKESFNEQASTLKDAVDSGSTSSEILMSLRWNLNKILLDSHKYDCFIRMKIKHIIKELDKVLNK